MWLLCIVQAEGIAAGLVNINDKQTSPEYVIRDGDCLVTHTHFHEPPVSDEKVVVLFDSPSMVRALRVCLAMRLGVFALLCLADVVRARLWLVRWL